MNKNRKIYNTVDLAKMYGIHPNTIRLYEKLGFISKAKRSESNYRMFKELHVLQIKLCRCIFGYPFTSRNIRNAGNEILWASAKKQWDAAQKCTDKYIEVIEHEIRKAQDAEEMLYKWTNPTNDIEILSENRRLSRREAANYLGVSIESVRNWERNGLIISKDISKKGEKLYSSAALGRMCVIYMLLQSGYSIASIYRSISIYEKGNGKLVTSALNNPECNDIVSAGDCWLYELLRLMKASQNIPSIIEELRTI